MRAVTLRSESMPPSFHRINIAQFLSALADNALLIVAIALLQRTGQPASWVPLLRFFFIIAYVALAPFVGALADAVPKARLMAWMNGLKWFGAAALALGLHPLLAFAVIGTGAAAYAPAKYGLVTELVEARRLVAANAWIEVTVVAAVLLGTAGGGYLVSAGFESTAFARAIGAWAGEHGWVSVRLAPALLVVLLLYGASSAINWRIRCVAPRIVALRLPVLGREFVAAHWMLWRDRDGGRLSLAVTSLFWGASAVMQFAVILIVKIPLVIQIRAIFRIDVGPVFVLDTKQVHFRRGPNASRWTSSAFDPGPPFHANVSGRAGAPVARSTLYATKKT